MFQKPVLKKFTVRFTPEGCTRITVWIPSQGWDVKDEVHTSYWPTLAKALAWVQETFEVQS